MKLTPEQQQLVTDNKELAQYIALYVWRQNKQDMEKEEVVSIAYEGLCKAALLYAPHSHGMSQETIDNGKAFAGFARIKINGAILDWQKANDHVPRRQRQMYKEFKTLGYGEGATIDYLAEKTGLTAKKVRAVIVAVEATSVSIDGNQDGMTSPEDVEENAVVSEILNSVSDAFVTLTPLQQEILTRRYFLQHEIPQISKDMSRSLLDIRAEHADGIIKLQKIMEKKSAESAQLGE
jgi:RNA polymerase sigma factor (sigma-70 family)